MNRAGLIIAFLMLLSIIVIEGCGRKTDPAFSPKGSAGRIEQGI